MRKPVKRTPSLSKRTGLLVKKNAGHRPFHHLDRDPKNPAHRDGPVTIRRVAE